jgi:hypothetical protein
MASVGQAITAVVGGVAGMMMGNPMLGLSLGMMVGGLLFPAKVEDQKNKPAPMGLQIQTSSYGLPVAKVYGTRVVAGNILDYWGFTPHEHVTETEVGGKGGGGQRTETTTYTYTVSFIIGLCLGPSTILRVWEGKNLIHNSDGSLTCSTMTFYDSTQVAANGTYATIRTPARVWKHLSYAIFLDYDLGGNPNLGNFAFELTGRCSLPAGTYITQLPGDTTTLDLARIAARNVVAKAYGTSVSCYDANTYAAVGATLTMAGTSLAGDATHYYRLSNGATGGTPPYYKRLHQYDLTGVQTGYVDFSLSNAPSGVSVPVAVHENAANPAEVLVQWKVNNGATELRGLTAGKRYITAINKTTLAVVSDTMFPGPAAWHSGECAVIQDPDYYYFFYIKWPPDERATVYVYSRAMVYVTEWASKAYLLKIFPDVLGACMYFSGWDLNTAGSNSHAACVDKLTGVVRWATANGSANGPSDSCQVAAFARNVFMGYRVGYTQHKVSVFQGIPDVYDVAPPDISYDILTNAFYGLGLSISYINFPAFEVTSRFCNDNDLLISKVYDQSKQKVLDILRDLIQHHDGYIGYFNGLIGHYQIKPETAIATLSTADNDIVIEPDKYPIQMGKKGPRSYQNRVIVQYTKRVDDYVTGTVIADDDVDMTAFGLKPAEIALDGLCTYTRAYYMAWLGLEKEMVNPETISFTLGPKNLGLKPGDVITVTDITMELTTFKIRILSLSEDDSYRIAIEALEELDNIGNYISIGGNDATPGNAAPDLYATPLPVINPIVFELPAVYSGEKNIVALSYSKANQTAWAGTGLHKAYAVGGPYTRIDSRLFSGVTGEVSTYGITAGRAWIRVILDVDKDLTSATSLAVLLTTPKQNMAVVRTATRDIFFRFEEATLISGYTWEIEGLIWDLTENAQWNIYNSITATDVIVFYQDIPYLKEVSSADSLKLLYWKIASWNFAGVEQDLSVVAAISNQMGAMAQTPLNPSNIHFNGTEVLDGGAITLIAAADIIIDWTSRNRFSDGWGDYTRSDTPVDDYDFIEFIIIIKSGATTKRITAVATKTWTYTAAMQATDSIGSPFTVTVQQRGISATSIGAITTITTV